MNPVNCVSSWNYMQQNINPINAELKLICHLLALLGAHHIFHVSRLRVNMMHGPMNIKFLQRFVECQLRHLLCDNCLGLSVMSMVMDQLKNICDIWCGDYETSYKS